MGSCEIIAEVTVNGLVFLGESPMTGTYICAATVTNPLTTSISPYVCTGVMTATQFGAVIANSEASQQVVGYAIENSCSLAVEVVGDSVKVIVFKAKEIHKQTKRSITETKRTFSAINTAEGMRWLMQYLSSM